MAYAPGFDFAVHWVEKRGQYRMRFMWYRNRMIYTYYEYITSETSAELVRTREPFRSVALVYLYAAWLPRLFIEKIAGMSGWELYRTLIIMFWVILAGIIALVPFI